MQTTLGGVKQDMEFQYFPAILTGVTALVVAFGGGIKWMLSRMDRHEEVERAWQAAERSKLETVLGERITSLERSLLSQNDEMIRVRQEIAGYVRHVGVLEGLLKAHGIEIPLMERPR
jgi:hypothetical protein